MTFTGRLAWEPLRTFNSSTLNGSYQAIGTPLANPSYILKMVNLSDVNVTISIDGINDIDILPAGGFFLYDESKAGLSSSQPALQANIQFFVKGTAGAGGNIYLVTQYIIQA